jgi:hypothetical protein
MLQELYHGRLNLSRLNYGVISLLPKIKDANSILQYRPICVLNVMFKAITKALTLRFTPLARQVISSLQTGFIPGRYILDGCVILHEVLHELKTSHSEGILLQLDFEKAYDRVQWPFLAEVMHRKNFPDRWIDWIRQAVEGGKVCVNMNGDWREYFSTFRGLRQGDPLSPLLFHLVGDALSAILDRAKEAGVIRGLVPHLIPGGISHLQYASDTLLFLHNDMESITGF